MKTEQDGSPIDVTVSETDTCAQASAFTSARMSGPRQRIEVITGADCRRRWSWEQKQAVVPDSVAPHVSPTAIAREYGLNTGQLYRWRRQILRRVPVVASAGFARVEIVEEPTRPTSPTTAAATTQTSLIEVVPPGGVSVRVDERVNERAPRRVLAALRGSSGRKADRYSDKRSARSRRRLACVYGWPMAGPTCAKESTAS
jgi:transposase